MDRRRETMASPGRGGGDVGREGRSAAASLAEQISQAVQSTSNLLQLMRDSSPSQAHLVKLPRNLMAKVPTVKNTGHVLEQLPQVIASLDAYTESSLQSVSHLKTVSQLLSNMESSQLKSLSSYRQPGELKDSVLDRSSGPSTGTSTEKEFSCESLKGNLLYHFGEPEQPLHHLRK